MNERLTIIEKKSTLKDNSPIIRITTDLIGLECHEQLYSGVITRMSSRGKIFCCAVPADRVDIQTLYLFYLFCPLSFLIIYVILKKSFSQNLHVFCKLLFRPRP